MAHLTSTRLNRIFDSQGDGTGTIEQNVAGKTLTDSTNATPIVITSVAHGFSDGDFINIQGMTGNTNANGLHVVASKADDTFELNDSDGADIAGNGAHGGTVTAHLCFVVKPATGTRFEFQRMNVIGGNNISVVEEEYVGETKLGTGLTVEKRNAAGIIHTLTSTPIRSWADWVLVAGTDVPLLDLTGNTLEAAVRWTFTKSGPALTLQGDSGEFVVMVINDDIDGLTYQRASIQGIQITP